MKFKNLTPILWTEKWEESIAFYKDVLKFSVIEKNEDWKWASLCKDEVEIMLAEPNTHEKYKKIGFSGSFYFRVNDVENLWNEIQSKAEICYPLETFEWQMKDFAIYDINGYRLQFGEDVSEISKEE